MSVLDFFEWCEATTLGLAIRMFPGKESTYDLLYRPRFQRLMREKYNLQ